MNVQEEQSQFSRKLICVTYPGLVNNVDKMLAMLGGLEKLEMAVGHPNKQLELRFRPRDVYSKPALADRDSSVGILLKIKVAPNKSPPDYEVVGVTKQTFKFDRLCDFQYLPLVTKEKEASESTLECVIDKLYPDQLPVYSEALLKGTTEEIPFLPPKSFIRHDMLQCKLHFERAHFYEGGFRPKFAQKEPIRKINEDPKSRRTIFFNFKQENVPNEPPELIQDALANKTILPENYNKMKEYFEKRPISSKNAVQFELGFSSEALKLLLPSVAYYHHNGPWRIMWVKYGYDPRKDPNTRKYQTFDFRLRKLGGLKFFTNKKEFSTHETDFKNPLSKLPRKTVLDESHVVFQPNTIPPYRQMFYQYCDLLLPEIQAMIARLPPILPAAKCHMKNGWLPSSFSDQCREILSKHIMNVIQSDLKKRELNKETEQELAGMSKNDNSPSGREFEDAFDLLEISDSDDENSEVEFDEFDSDDDDDDNSKEKNYHQDSDNEIDLEVVEEVNRLVASSSMSRKKLKDELNSVCLEEDSD